MAPHSSTLAWKVPWMEEPGGLQSMGSLRVGHNERLHFHFSLSCIGEGNGNPLQCSCLENPRDGGAWWAAVCGVAQSRTRLKRLSSSCSSRTVFRCKHWPGDRSSSSRWEQCPWTRVIQSFPTLQLYHLGVPPGSHFFFFAIKSLKKLENNILMNIIVV